MPTVNAMQQQVEGKARIYIEVRDSYQIKDALKAAGYVYGDKYWYTYIVGSTKAELAAATKRELTRLFELGCTWCPRMSPGNIAGFDAIRGSI